MIVLVKPNKIDPWTWYWCCEHCGACPPSEISHRYLPHSHNCPAKTWERKIDKPWLVAPDWFCSITFFICAIFGWVLPEYYWHKQLLRASKKEL